MSRVTLNLPEDLLVRVKNIADKERLTMTDVFRRSLEMDLFLDKEEENESKVLIKRKTGPMVEIIRPR